MTNENFWEITGNFCGTIPKVPKNYNIILSSYSGGPLFCNFRTRKSYKVRGTYYAFRIVDMKTAWLRIKKVWKFRIDPISHCFCFIFNFPCLFRFLFSLNGSILTLRGPLRKSWYIRVFFGSHGSALTALRNKNQREIY